MTAQQPSPSLTVAIPTYNRNSILERNLPFLLKQLTADCELLIIDNHSDTPVSETVEERVKASGANYRIVRNVTNVGGNANIMRCFELCRTEWIWIIGDDDEAMPEAVQTILRTVREHPNAIYVNFSYDDRRPATTVSRGAVEFAAMLDTSSNLPWISPSVWNAAAMLPNLKFGYHYAYSTLPHVALLLSTLVGEAECVLHRDQVVRGEWQAPSVDQRWALLNWALGLPTLFDLALSHEVRYTLARKLLWPGGGESISLGSIVYEMLVSPDRYDRNTCLYYFDQIWRRWYYFDSRLPRRVRALFYRTLLMFPRTARALLRLNKKLKGKPVVFETPDRYRRV
jgi:glycosyltransferase involved in cell wall biosynthesis